MRLPVVCLIAFFTFFSVISLAQKVLIIDTLRGYDISNINPDNILQPCYSSIDGFESANSFQTSYNLTYPNVITKGITANQACLLLDNKGGVLQINNIKSFPTDTIRISKWMIHKNGLTDTVRGSKAYFQMYNDSIAEEPCKIETIFYTTRNRGTKNLNYIDVSINGKRHNIPVKILTVPLLQSSFHGYSPRKSYKAFMRNNETDKKVYRYKRFMGETETIVRRFNAMLRL